VGFFTILVIKKFMDKKTVISLVIILIGVTSLVWWSKSADKKNLSAGQIVNSLSAEEVFYDFGTISMKNGDVGKLFKVTNSTSEDIALPNLTTSCMCTAAYFVEPDGNKSGPFGMPGMGFVPKLNKTIKAGQSAGVEVVYDPNAHGPAGVGMIDRFIYLEDASGNKLQFEIKANVTP
jgi:Protein of unknown function (DUF1573)